MKNLPSLSLSLTHSLSLSLSLSPSPSLSLSSANMAISADSQGTSSDSIVGNDVQLTENDIPGASLKEPFESHTVSQLRWWLLCRGIVAPTSWKKPQVIQRCVLMILVY